MKIKIFLRHAFVCLLIAVLTSCGESETQESTPSAPKVSAVTLTPSRLDITEDLPGRVAPIRIAEIRPQVSGIVQHRLFEQGSEVLAGQPLFQINPAPFRTEVDTAAAALQRAESALARARLEATRLQPLVKAEAISRQTYDNAVSLRDQADADVAQARAALARRQLDLQFATVEAPISGRIDQAMTTEGALVSSSDTNPMAHIQQIDQVYVDVRRPASSLESLRQKLASKDVIASDGLSVEILRSDRTAYDVKGRILFSGINVDAGTGDVLLRVLVDNPQRELLPGMFVRARVPLASYDKALTIPQQAVVHSSGQPQVWILDGGNHVRLATVELGEMVNRSYRIRAGLSAGQKVVVEGMERLTDNVVVSAQEWMPSDSTSSTSAQ